jgi:acyl-CoA synthetase (NDP forming)
MTIDFFFEPKSLALIGSSKIRISQNMISPEIFERTAKNVEHFEGEKYILDIENSKIFPEVDLVVITLPPKETLEILRKIKAKGAIILPGGFNREERKKILKIAKSRKFRILGPNSVCGIINPEIGLNTTFEKPFEMKSGEVAIISQSGGVGATLLDLATYYKLGISKFVWIGDMSDVNEIELVKYFMNDKKTGIIVMYIEGLKDPRMFMKIAKTSKKPIFVLKGGISEEAKERALSHTDSLSSSYEIYSAAFKQSGVMESHSLGELFNQVIVLDRFKGRLKGKRVGIISNTGGSSILAADWCYKFGLELSKFSELTKRNIHRLYPRLNPINPLDIIADADGKRFKDITEIVAKDSNVDAIIVINQLKSCLLNPEDINLLKRVKTGKPIIDCAPGADDFNRVKFFLRDSFPIFSSVKNAVKAVKKLYELEKLKR